jgi:hypothetical protein
MAEGGLVTPSPLSVYWQNRGLKIPASGIRDATLKAEAPVQFNVPGLPSSVVLFA